MIYFIHSQFGSKFQKSSINLLIKIAKKLKKKFKIIIVDHLSKKNFQLADNINSISSNHEYREFSNWESGLIYLRDKKPNLYNSQQFEGLVVSNDSVLQHRPFDIAKLDSFIEGVKSSISQKIPTLFGDVSEIKSSPPYFNESRVSKYVSTYIFFFNKTGFKLLKSFINKNVDKIFCKNNENNSVLSNTGLVNNSKNYYQYLERWLYKKNLYDKWYLHQALNHKNFDFLKLKFKSIVLEHYLSQSFVEKKGVLLDWNKFYKRDAFYYKINFYIKTINYEIFSIYKYILFKFFNYFK